MTFVPAQLLLNAVTRLEGAHPLAVVSIPALLRQGARNGTDPTTTPVDFGSGEETALLDDFFALPRPPEADRPYKAIWSSDKPEDGGWQKRKYPGGGLQRLRTDHRSRGRIFVQIKRQRQRDSWGLTTLAGSELAATSAQSDMKHPVSLCDLAIWFGRNVDLSNLSAPVTANLPQGADDMDRLMAWFNHEFEPDKGDLVGTIYDDTIPSDYRSITFSVAPVDDATYENLGSLPPAPTYTGSMKDLTQQVEAHVASRGFTVPEGLVQRVMTAWLNGDIVLLVGQPGTGKSHFASLVAEAFETQLGTDPAVTVSVRADFDEAEFIGYERLDGTAQLREFSAEVLKSGEPLAAHIVILEEFNLAAIENYLASVLVATQDNDRAIRLPSGEPVQLPVDAFIMGTCNSYLDEPETRMRVSTPTKRRSSIITMPNVLAIRYGDGDVSEVLDFAVEMVRNETERIKTRLAASRGSQFDSLRLSALETVRSPRDLSDEARTALGNVCCALLDTPIGASWFTAGLLRDVALTVARAERDPQAELAALGDAIASKVVHQLRGSHSDIQDFRSAIATLPNADEITALTDRMMDGPSDDLIPLL